MKRWTRILIAGIVIVLSFGVMYELSTHVVRGWFRGEAFYQGRPTSYWAARCDVWLDRWDSPEDAAEYAQGPVGFGVKNEHGNPEHLFFEILNVARCSKARRANIAPKKLAPAAKILLSVTAQQDDWYGPEVLWGSPDTEPVVRELIKEKRFRPFAEWALERMKLYHEQEQDLLDRGREIVWRH